jgi:hypothetical protein
MSVRKIPAQVEWSCSTCTDVALVEDDFAKTLGSPAAPKGWSEVRSFQTVSVQGDCDRVWHLCPRCADGFLVRMAHSVHERTGI